MYRIETSLHLFVSWQLVGHFIPDLIKVWIVTDVPTMLQLCAHIVCSVSDTIQVLAAAFDGFEKYLAAFCLLPFLSTTKKKGERKQCASDYCHFPCDKQLILDFDFPLYSPVTTTFSHMTCQDWLLPQPLYSFILSVIHPYQCALVNGKSGFASA